MSDLLYTPARIKTALFIDFDNIYIRLRELHPDAAKQFATTPTAWLTWIEQQLKYLADVNESTPAIQRAVLMRRCYLNPRRFHQFRPYFTRAAFSVIDCPSLTDKGKNSSDIRMVMDIVDTLNHPTHFDEFIILSGDSDFTPVLLRLRNHDRRTAVLIIGPAAEAYKAACDCLISEGTFIRDALGVTDGYVAYAEHRGHEVAGVSSALLNEVAHRVYDEADATGEVTAIDLPRVFGEFEQFRQSNWFGFYSLRNLTEDIVRRHRGLALVDSDPWKVVADSSQEFFLAETDFDPEEWDDHSNHLSMSHTARVHTTKLQDLPSELIEFIYRVHRISGTPKLTPMEFAHVFSATEEVLRDSTYHTVTTSKAVRDLCGERGESIARSNIMFILRGIALSGHRFSSEPSADTAENFAQHFFNNVISLCQDAHVELSDDEIELLSDWICSGLAALMACEPSSSSAS